MAYSLGTIGLLYKMITTCFLQKHGTVFTIEKYEDAMEVTPNQESFYSRHDMDDNCEVQKKVGRFFSPWDSWRYMILNDMELNDKPVWHSTVVEHH